MTYERITLAKNQGLATLTLNAPDKLNAVTDEMSRELLGHVARLDADGLVELDAERKAAMVSNMLVVLCSDHSTQPVVNTGTLYQ